MERGVATWLVVVVVVVGVAAPGVAAGGPSVASTDVPSATPTADAAGASTAPSAVASRQPESPFGLPQEFDPDTVALGAELAADGDAEWEFTYRMQLATDNETEAFKELRDDISANTSEYLDQFRGRITNTVDAAENATEREMAVANVSVSTRFNSLNEDSLGRVTYSFEWRGFATADGDRVTAGDALEGFYLDNQTSLTVSWPSGYALESVDPVGTEPRERAVSWSGPLDFGPDQPRVQIAPAAEPTTTSPTETTTTEAPGGSGNGAGGDGGGGNADTTTLVVPAAVGAIVAVLVLGAGGWLYLRRRGTDGSLDGFDDGSGASGDGGAPGARAGDAPAAGSAAAGADGGESPAGDDDGPPSELLSNEERVEQFLESQGGRAKQQAVVETLDWTEAKTSQVVNEMQDAGDIEKFRIGRENVLKLPDAEDLDE
jgi:hypothetical protein